MNLRSVVRTSIVGLMLVAVTSCGVGQEPTATPPATSAGAPSTSQTLPPIEAPSTAAEAPRTSAPAQSSPAQTSADPTADAPIVPEPQALAAPPSGPVLSVSPPVALSVPAIGIESPLIELGRNTDGTVEVPSLDDPDSKPGWYRNSPTPGALGPAIILGHVDSRRFGPGIFYRLQDLAAGDSIEVSRADGTVAQFVVDAVESVQKSNFPTLQVYGNLDHSGLRLITCGGEFDPAAQSYESNIIVFASLVGSRAA